MSEADILVGVSCDGYEVYVDGERYLMSFEYVEDGAYQLQALITLLTGGVVPPIEEIY